MSATRVLSELLGLACWLAAIYLGGRISWVIPVALCAFLTVQWWRGRFGYGIPWRRLFS